MKTLTRSAFLKTSAAAAGALVVPNGLFAERRAPAFLRGARKTVNFWSFTNTRTAWQKKAWALYQKRKKPDFDINWVILPYNQMHDKVMIAGQAGSGGPDIADIEISQFGRFIKGEVIFADLTPRLEKIGALNNLYRPSATDPWSWKGRVYGLGNELNTCLLSYRWDIWKKAGVRTPINTWDEFVDQARRYHRDTGKYLIDFPFDTWGSWWMLTLQQGGGFFGPDGQVAFNSPKGLKTLTFMQKAIKDRWAMLRAPDTQRQSYIAALSSGTVSCLLGPSWNFSGFVQQSLAQTKGQWHLQPFPAWIKGGSRTATWGGTGVTVLKASPMAAEAADFVVWEHTTTEAVLFDYEERQTWPTWRPAFKDPRLSQPIAFFDNQRVGQLIEQVSGEINRWYNSPFWPETTDAFVRKALTPALLNNAPPAAALKAAQSDATNIIRFETA